MTNPIFWNRFKLCYHYIQLKLKHSLKYMYTYSRVTIDLLLDNYFHMSPQNLSLMRLAQFNHFLAMRLALFPPFSCNEVGVVSPFSSNEAGVVSPLPFNEAGVVSKFSCNEAGIVSKFSCNEAGVVYSFSCNEARCRVYHFYCSFLITP